MSISKRVAVIVFFCASLLAVNTSATEPSVGSDESQLRQIILAIRHGWESGDGSPFYQYLLDRDGVRFIENGGQYTGVKDLVEQHVEPEGVVFEGLRIIFSNVETHVEGDFAWAIVDVTAIATVRRDGKRIHNHGYETFLFRRVEAGWKVLHTHSSTRPVLD